MTKDGLVRNPLQNQWSENYNLVALDHVRYIYLSVLGTKHFSSRSVLVIPMEQESIIVVMQPTTSMISYKSSSLSSPSSPRTGSMSLGGRTVAYTFLI